MPAQINVPTACRGVAEHLIVQFAGVLPPTAVLAAVQSGERELRGQIPAGSLDEMLHRLVAYRLHELAGMSR